MVAYREMLEIYAGDTRTIRLPVRAEDAALLDLGEEGASHHVEMWIADKSMPTVEQVRVRLTEAQGVALVSSGGKWFVEATLLEEHTGALPAPHDYYIEARVTDENDADVLVTCSGILTVRRSMIAHALLAGEIVPPEPVGSPTLAAVERAETAATDAESSRDVAAGYAAQTQADAVATAADRVATGLDAVATAADRVATGEDVVAAAASRSAAETARTAAEAAVDEVDALGDAKIAVAQAAASDAEAAAALTAADAIATAADRVQTGLDRIATAADRTQASASAGAAASDKLAVEGLLASFRGIHLGSFANDSAATTAAASFGVTLVDGVQYSNTTTNQIRIWFDGAWADYDASSEQQLQAAQLSAGQAAASASSAQGSANAASDSATTAAAEKVLAQTARTGAETAQTGAQTARTGAETAQAAAQTARTGAETARDAAQAAQAAAAASEAGVDASELLAQQWAQNPVDEPVIAADPEDPATSDQYSALHWANKSEVSQGIAGSYATSAVDAANSARIAANNAVAVVTGGTASLTAAAGRMPIADATGKIDPAWIDPIAGVNAAALHRSPNAITSMFIYDTSKDSDGGAWTEKCQHTSWYNEPLMGKWLGAWDNETNARYANATVGNELVVNGGFDADTNWTKTAGWTIDGGKATQNLGAGYPYISQSYSYTAGKTYKVTVVVSGHAAGSALFWTAIDRTYGPTMSSNGTFSFVFTASALDTNIGVIHSSPGGGGRYSIDSISVREVTAINTASGDYFQLTTDGKFYRLWKNGLAYSENFANAAWNKFNVSLVHGITDPSGGLTATQVTATAANAQINQIGAAIPFSNHVGSIYVRRVSGTGTVNILATNGGFGPALALTGSWQRFEVNNTPTTNGQLFVGIRIVTSGDVVEIAFAQGELGSVATAYERKDAGYTTTETFRGNKADFPKLAAIVGENTNLTIYDLNEPGRPMAFRFVSATNNMLQGNISSIAAREAEVCVGSSSGLFRMNFAKDAAYQLSTAADKTYNTPMAQRNAANGYA